MINNFDFTQQINISDFNYNLPDNRIAKYPLPERDLSKLLVYRNNEITDSLFSNIDNFLNNNDLLFFNNTKVVPARILFQKPTGAQIEIFCLEPISPADYALSFQSKQCSWKCIVGNLKKWKNSFIEKELIIDGDKIILKAEKLQEQQSAVDILFTWNKESVTFERIIESAGLIPIPPYLNRPTEELDKKRYQTIYSKIKGSVAAPTAGLHFTENTFKKLSLKNITTGNVTLHVGAGTFKPVQSEKISGHEMHTEYYSVNKRELEKLIQNSGNVIAVGTTTLRTLESLYFCGLKINPNKPLQDDYNFVNQWEPYKTDSSLTYKQSLENILDYLDKNNLETFNGHTQIMIVPGYRPKSIKALITNFHQPKSTLLLLISSIVGLNWQKIYDFALENNYRFLSYGDSSLLYL